jgi:putative nucleotidyltransferase with HDIG domain
MNKTFLNAYDSKIEIGMGGVLHTFRSAESAYQAFKNPAEFHSFTKLSPSEALNKGRAVALRKDWDEIKDEVMLFVLKIKFEDPYLRKMLMNEEDFEGNRLKPYLLKVKEYYREHTETEHNANPFFTDYLNEREERLNEEVAFERTYRPLSDDKVSHSKTVAEFMLKNAERYGVDPAKAYIVGLLHDIGYIAGRRGHEEKGAEMLCGLGMDEDVVNAIRFHGTKPKEMEKMIKGTRAENDTIKLITLLYEADMSVDVKGRNVGTKERLRDIRARYGDGIEYETARAEVDFVKEFGKKKIKAEREDN